MQSDANVIPILNVFIHIYIYITQFKLNILKEFCDYVNVEYKSIFEYVKVC